jgi:hypothetical protein
MLFQVSLLAVGWCSVLLRRLAYSLDRRFLSYLIPLNRPDSTSKSSIMMSESPIVSKENREGRSYCRPHDTELSNSEHAVISDKKKSTTNIAATERKGDEAPN